MHAARVLLRFFSFKVEKKVEKLKKQLTEVKKYSMIPSLTVGK